MLDGAVTTWTILGPVAYQGLAMLGTHIPNGDVYARNSQGLTQLRELRNPGARSHRRGDPRRRAFEAPSCGARLASYVLAAENR